jgi:hypothetical protein
MPRISQKNVENYAKLRLLVGCLGEKDNFDWWGTTALSVTGAQYHKILFPRTSNKSSALATVQAAKAHHDSRVGATRTYHLFRLPSEIEKRIFDSIDEQGLLPDSRSKDDCLAELEQMEDGQNENGTGPVMIGGSKDVTKTTSISQIASLYLNAFKSGQNCIPYFTNA